MDYYNMKLENIYKNLKSSPNGLTQKEAELALQKYGENKIVERKKKSALRRFISQFNDMMILILIVVAIFMGFVGYFYSHDYTDTIVIAVVVLLNAIMGFIQEEKAEVTLEGLKKYATQSCKVRRGGEIHVVDATTIVPGDIIVLDAGDQIPADARIIQEMNVTVDESPLTGESVPIRKNTKALLRKLPLQEQSNMLFSGCNITNGRVEAIVVKTGMLTELGRIAVSLNTPYEVMTPLQIKIKEISKKITLLIFFILLFIFFYGLWKGYAFLEILMLCISLSVAAIPEGLPAVITIALSGGAGTLARKNTIVRQMSAVETLGATDIICSDKTGTITQNKMKVKKTVLYDEEKFALIASLANETILDKKKMIGDPTETCLYEYLSSKGIDPFKIKDTMTRIIDAPFDSKRKMMSTINEVDGKIYLFVKGSLDNLLGKCKQLENEGKKIKLSPTLEREIKKEEKEMASSALRVMGFAYKELKEIPQDAQGILKEEEGLIFVGLVGIIDPPRKSVISSVKKCKKAGIRPIMITGDSLATACAIAKEVGIIENDDEGILGQELDEMSEEELKKVVIKYNVYARVSPEHKQRIVAAWQSLGRVVAMTGDGVNDAPAIKDAHVGVGMGITGTEVTKSVADIILMDDSFSTIVVAIEEGRRIFTNIRNNVVYSLSSNFAELFSIIIGMFSGVTILLPIHILFIDLVTDSIPSICLSFEKSEKGIMEKKPRGIDKPMFTPFVKANIVYSAIVETLFVLIVFFFANSVYSSEVACTLALLSLVMQEIIYAISCRNLESFVWKQGLFSNSYMNIGILIVILIEALVFLTPLGSVLNIVALEISLLWNTVLFNLFGFVFYEGAKPILKRIFKD